MMCYQVKIALHEGWAESRLRNEMSQSICSGWFDTNTELERVQTVASPLGDVVQADGLFTQTAPARSSEGTRQWEDSSRTVRQHHAPENQKKKPREHSKSGKKLQQKITNPILGSTSRVLRETITEQFCSGHIFHVCAQAFKTIHLFIHLLEAY